MDQFIIADMFQDGLEEQITEAVVLAPGEVILFFGRWSREGLLLGDMRDVGFHLGDPVNWAGREPQVEMMVCAVQEGFQAITDTCGKELKPGGPGHPK